MPAKEARKAVGARGLGLGWPAPPQGIGSGISTPGRTGRRRVKNEYRSTASERNGWFSGS